MKDKLNIKSLLIVMLLFLTLFRLYIFSVRAFIIVSIVLSLMLLVICKPNSEKIKENIIPIVLSIIVFLATFVSGMTIYNFLNGLHYSLQFLSLYLVTNYLVKKDGLQECIKNYFIVSLLFVLAMDLSVLIGLEFDIMRYQNLSSFLFGNKFMLAYFHMQTFGLMALYDSFRNKKNITKYIVFCIISLSMCLITGCLTGIVGILVITLMLILPLGNNIKKELSDPRAIFMILFLVEFFLIASSYVYNTPFVQYIVDDILHKGNSMNGRYIIYGLLKPVILDNFILGYGYNATIITRILGYGNAQNGLFQCMLDFGIIGTIIFIINWYKSINIKFNQKNWPLYCLLYAFIICSSVEVCFKFNFYLVLAIFLNIRFLQQAKNK